MKTLTSKRVVLLGGSWLQEWEHKGTRWIEQCLEIMAANLMKNLAFSGQFYPGFQEPFSVLGPVGVGRGEENLGRDPAMSRKTGNLPWQFFPLLCKAGPSDVIGTRRCLWPLLWLVPRKMIFAIEWRSFPQPRFSPLPFLCLWSQARFLETQETFLFREIVSCWFQQ